jgi:Bacterial EndoU nuclease
MYENRHGRFTAVDPLLASGKSANPQSFNRYVYVLNNPIVATDPSGMQTNSNPNFRPPSTAGTKPCDFDNPSCSLYRRDAPVGEVTVNGGGSESLLAAQEDYATTISNAVLNQPTSTGQVNYPIRAMLMGFPANPWEQAGEGSVTGLKNVPIVLWNSATSGRLKYDSGGLSFGPNPVEIQPYGCNNRIGCSWSGGTTGAALIAPGVVGAVFSGGAASLSLTSVQANSEYVNLASAARTKHILAGDATGGGHSWFSSWTSLKNGMLGRKSMFPMSWSEGKTMNAVSEVATNPFKTINQTGVQGSYFTRAGNPAILQRFGTYEGVTIKVVTNGSDIITSHPWFKPIP